MEMEALSEERIMLALSTQTFGRRLHLFDSIPSTNTKARRFAAAGAPEGTLVIADEQTAGKGRRGRHWVAPARTCLLFSLVFRPALQPRQVARLTMLASLAAAEAIEATTELPVAIKWPNDLVISGPPGAQERVRKLGGILTETALTGERLAYGIVGMGININVNPAALGRVMTPATSLLAELGRPVDRISLLAAILERIESRSPELAGEQIAGDWAARLVTVGQQVSVSQGTGDSDPLEGYAEGVAPDGELILRDLAGNLHLIAAGDVTLRPPVA
jgi:BirA family biotin operon repressor/biotin-[acetyl-CoA-carboxylase] ligase